MKDRQLITKFLDETQTELAFIVGNVYSLLPEEEQLVSSLKNAWHEIIPAFEIIKDQLNIIDADTLLVVGLSNYQLILKYDLFTSARSAFREKSQDIDMLNGKQKKVAKDNIISALEAMHTILFSLKNVIPNVDAIISFNSVLKIVLGR
ncbi:MAG: hypothetical protein WBB67_06440 [bacterium]